MCLARHAFDTALYCCVTIQTNTAPEKGEAPIT